MLTSGDGVVKNPRNELIIMQFVRTLPTLEIMAVVYNSI